MKFSQMIQRAADILYPPRCILCSELIPLYEPRFFCRACREDPDIISEPFCALCGAPLPDGEDCAACGKYARLFDQNRSVFLYQKNVADAIRKMKYFKRTDYAEGFGQLMAELLLGYYPKTVNTIDGIVPVPLHEDRLRQRGYNQSELLADEISKRLGIPLYRDLLLRVKHTEAQYNLSPAERRKNVRDAFDLNLCGSTLPCANILLIDDIFTTGSTLNECAKVLKAAGANFVGAYTLAMAHRSSTISNGTMPTN